MTEVKCPECNMEITEVEDEWPYSQYKVRLYRCGECGRGIRTYSQDGQVKFTIPKGAGLGEATTKESTIDDKLSFLVTHIEEVEKRLDDIEENL